jgi:hypothetical protein
LDDIGNLKHGLEPNAFLTDVSLLAIDDGLLRTVTNTGEGVELAEGEANFVTVSPKDCAVILYNDR